MWRLLRFWWASWSQSITLSIKQQYLMLTIAEKHFQSKPDNYRLAIDLRISFKSIHFLLHSVRSNSLCVTEAMHISRWATNKIIWAATVRKYVGLWSGYIWLILNSQWQSNYNFRSLSFSVRSAWFLLYCSRDSEVIFFVFAVRIIFCILSRSLGWN